nr:MAG TPA_asm: hypothetical protein [Caudoviricetes sp.]
MYLYYDLIENKKIVTVTSKTKLDYLGDNYVIKKKEEIPEGGILYLDDKGNIKVEVIKEIKLDDVAKEINKVEKKINDTTSYFAEAQIEGMEKQTQSEQMLSMGIAEIYDEITKIKEALKLE